MAAVFACAAVGPALADAEAFRINCAKCHARAQTVAKGLKGDTAEARRAALEAFLSTHHADDPAIRAQIAAYLVTLAGK